MKLVMLFALVVILILGMTMAVIEVYRIEMDSYTERMVAFYSEVFDYMLASNGTFNGTGVMPF